MTRPLAWSSVGCHQFRPSGVHAVLANAAHRGDMTTFSRSTSTHAAEGQTVSPHLLVRDPIHFATPSRYHPTCLGA